MNWAIVYAAFSVIFSGLSIRLNVAKTLKCTGTHKCNSFLYVFLFIYLFNWRLFTTTFSCFSFYLFVLACFSLAFESFVENEERTKNTNQKHQKKLFKWERSHTIFIPTIFFTCLLLQCAKNATYTIVTYFRSVMVVMIEAKKMLIRMLGNRCTCNSLKSYSVMPNRRKRWEENGWKLKYERNRLLFLLLNCYNQNVNSCRLHTDRSLNQCQWCETLHIYIRTPFTRKMILTMFNTV